MLIMGGTPCSFILDDPYLFIYTSTISKMGMGIDGVSQTLPTMSKFVPVCLSVCYLLFGSLLNYILRVKLEKVYHNSHPR